MPGRFVKATAFRAASIERWKDAECLHAAGRYQGAIYLCGYAIECELKYCVCSARRMERIAEVEAKRLGHDLGRLLYQTSRVKRLSGDRDLFVAFQALSSRWSTDIRYTGRRSDARDSERFLKDSWVLLTWLRTESGS